MAKDQTRRIKPSVLQDDRDALAAIKAFTNYAPANTEYALAKLETKATAMNTARETEAQKRDEADAARDDATTAEWAFHNYILAAKKQVLAQYGEDSNEAQAVGLKKKSEWKSPSRKTTPPPPQ